jgi:hypothetical protein
MEQGRVRTLRGIAWTWIVPIVASLLVFVAVLLTTPPGFAALGGLFLGPLRGIDADAAAYALGAAASLALVVLGALSAMCWLVGRVMRA